mmetsp:Transcript_21159/g.58323  ORF Transcript_21159/g.58323 Transcript_21159/m.58323 type:complete len:89 (-) Transcript_21159:1460-1726(-)
MACRTVRGGEIFIPPLGLHCLLFFRSNVYRDLSNTKLRNRMKAANKTNRQKGITLRYASARFRRNKFGNNNKGLGSGMPSSERYGPRR